MLLITCGGTKCKYGYAVNWGVEEAYAGVGVFKVQLGNRPKIIKYNIIIINFMFILHGDFNREKNICKFLFMCIFFCSSNQMKGDTPIYREYTVYILGQIPQQTVEHE